MKRNLPPLHHLAVVIGAVLLTGLMGGCNEAIPTAPGSDPPLAAAKGNRPAAGSLSVSAVDPDTVPADTVLTVRVLGSGFTEGSDVTWELEGTTTDAVTTVAPVIFVSAKELHARISVTPDAPLARYDVVVTVAGGKRGIGVESLTVVAKPIPLPVPSEMNISQADDVNDQGVVVGYGIDREGRFRALRWWRGSGPWQVAEITSGLAGAGTSLAAMFVNNQGDVVLRRWPVVATPEMPVAFSVQTGSGGEADIAADWIDGMNDAGTLIGEAEGRPVVWRRLGPSTWSGAEQLPSLPGYRNARFTHINAGNDVAGYVADPAGVNWPAVWEHSGGAWGAARILAGAQSGVATGVNAGGALVGTLTPCGDTSCDPVPVYWSAPDSPPLRLLPADRSNLGGYAWELNDEGIVIGRAWLPSGKSRSYSQRGVVWYAATAKLVDLGAVNGDHLATMTAVSNGFPALVAGYVNRFKGEKQAMVWTVF
ncbi:MAG TPA: hypothetical protein VLA43_01940 [Longimicrobiales bacterium]|nr:hypothetical protein [Longimicrobiales bacterium]